MNVNNNNQGVIGCKQKHAASRGPCEIMALVYRCCAVPCVVADVGPCRESFDGLYGYIPANFNEGVMLEGVTTAADCEHQCWLNSTCIRYVFITDVQIVGSANRVCYLFFSRSVEFVERPGSTLYFRRRCVTLTNCGAMTTTRKQVADVSCICTLSHCLIAIPSLSPHASSHCLDREIDLCAGEMLP